MTHANYFSRGEHSTSILSAQPHNIIDFTVKVTHHCVANLFYESTKGKIVLIC